MEEENVLDKEKYRMSVRYRNDPRIQQNVVQVPSVN